jgi:hypothetical protein
MDSCHERHCQLIEASGRSPAADRFCLPMPIERSLALFAWGEPHATQPMGRIGLQEIK